MIQQHRIPPQCEESYRQKIPIPTSIHSFSVPHVNDNDLVYSFILIFSSHIRVSKLEAQVVKWFQIWCNVNFTTHFQHFSSYQEHIRHISWFPVRTAHSREFVYDFCFVSCKTSQNVAFRIYLQEVNSNFHVNRHFWREALCFILPDISLDENLHSCKSQWSCWKKSLKCLKDKVCDS